MCLVTSFLNVALLMPFYWILLLTESVGPFGEADLEEIAC